MLGCFDVGVAVAVAAPVAAAPVADVHLVDLNK